MLSGKTELELIQSLSKKLLENIEKCQIKSKKTICTISSTAIGSKLDLQFPYLSPLREFDRFSIIGVIVFTQAQALFFAELVDGKVDIILVDAEKKIPMVVDSSISFISNDLMKINNSNHKTISYIETGNLSSVCGEAIKKSKFYIYKPNDITVESVYCFITQKIHDLSGKSAALIAAGNLGSKLALKLVESGVAVTMNRRDHSTGFQISAALNCIKPDMTIANINYSKDILKACFESDIIIGCGNSNVIDSNHIKAANKNVLLIDVGKGSFTENALIFCNQNGINIYRSDITAALYGFTQMLLEQHKILNESLGRVYVDGIEYISGGLLGGFQAVVVDNCFSPTKILGLADGFGGFIREINDHQLSIIEKAKKRIT